MPPPDGIELTKRIRGSATNRTTPIVIITGAEDRGLMARAFQAGANWFLFKARSTVAASAPDSDLPDTHRAGTPQNLARQSEMRRLHRIGEGSPHRGDPRPEP